MIVGVRWDSVPAGGLSPNGIYCQCSYCNQCAAVSASGAIIG